MIERLDESPNEVGRQMMVTATAPDHDENRRSCPLVDDGTLPGVRTTDGRHGCRICEDLPCLATAISQGNLPFLAPQAIVPDLQATTKEGAFREILRQLVKTGALSATDLEDATTAVLSREDKGSTGIGHGIAIPHASHGAVRREVGAVARSRCGIEFDSLDGQRVQLIFLLLSPPDNPGDHIRALAAIAKHVRMLGMAD